MQPKIKKYFDYYMKLNTLFATKNPKITHTKKKKKNIIAAANVVVLPLHFSFVFLVAFLLRCPFLSPFLKETLRS